MKDHLNVTVTANPLSQPSPVVDNRQHRLPGKIQEETAGSVPAQSGSIPREDTFDGRFGGIDPGRWDDSAIDEMDLSKALELSASIRQQAQSSEGRRMMGLAHHTITPQQVGQLFGGM